MDRGDPVELDGEVTMGGDLVAQAAGSNAVGTRAEGTLTGGGHVATVEADLIGGFRGDPIVGLTLVPEASAVTLDGVAVPADVGVTGAG